MSSYIIGVGDQVWLAVIALIGTIFGGVLTIMLEVIRRRQNEAEKKIDKQVILAEATYTFQNHAMGLQKKALAIACRSKADLTRDAVDIADAVNAEREWAEHQKGQAKVDAQALLTRAEEQARKVLQEASVIRPEPVAVDKPKGSVAELMAEEKEGKAADPTIVSIAQELSKTHDIKGTVELTPKES